MLENEMSAIVLILRYNNAPDASGEREENKPILHGSPQI